MATGNKNALKSLLDYDEPNEDDSDEEKSGHVAVTNDYSSESSSEISEEEPPIENVEPDIQPKVARVKDIEDDEDFDSDIETIDDVEPKPEKEETSVKPQRPSVFDPGRIGRKTRGSQEFTSQLVGRDPSEVKLPPPPPGRCSKDLQSYFEEKHKQMLESGFNMNAKIKENKNFRNPSIYEKLVQFLGIDEKGTNYPPALFDPHCWKRESYYDSLAKAQKLDMDRREKERKSATKVEFVSGVVKRPIGEERKSKWDIVSTASPQAPITVPSIPVIHPALTKPTIIPAVGALKKPKLDIK